MAKFRKKPVEVDAMQFDGENRLQIIDFADTAYLRFTHDSLFQEVLIIKTLEGEMMAFPGDWIIKGVAGEFYPCKNHIFEQTYEAVG